MFHLPKSSKPSLYDGFLERLQVGIPNIAAINSFSRQTN